MLLVDTNILVELLIEGDRTVQAQALWQRDPQWCSEPSALIEWGISAYDARFIAAAFGTGLSLITEDARLRAAVADRTLSLAEALAA